MMRQDEFDHIYYQYMDLKISMLEKVTEYRIKNPDRDASEQLKIIDRVDYLGAMIHKLYHITLQSGIAHGDFMGERERLLQLHANEKYRMKQKISDLEKENEELKEQCLKHI